MGEFITLATAIVIVKTICPPIGQIPWDIFRSILHGLCDFRKLLVHVLLAVVLKDPTLARRRQQPRVFILEVRYDLERCETAKLDSDRTLVSRLALVNLPTWSEWDINMPDLLSHSKR